MLLKHITTLCRKTPLVQSSRCLARTSQQPRPGPKDYRLWTVPGELVRRKEILAKQYTMYWHPGLNVGIDNDRIIYALCDGIVVFSEEQFDPDHDHPVVKEAYTNGTPYFKRYINVIPRRRVSEFKLIDLV